MPKRTLKCMVATSATSQHDPTQRGKRMFCQLCTGPFHVHFYHKIYALVSRLISVVQLHCATVHYMPLDYVVSLRVSDRYYDLSFLIGIFGKVTCRDGIHNRCTAPYRAAQSLCAYILTLFAIPLAARNTMLYKYAICI